MKMKFGAIVVAGSGKIGGHVAAKNRGGAYLRTKTTPSNAQTSAQSGVRNLFTSLSQAWRALDQEQRDAWNAAVADYSRTDIFGDIRVPSGSNLFQRLNNNLINVGQSMITSPPLPAEVVNIVLVSLTKNIVGGIFDVEFSPAISVGTSVKVFATAPMSAGKSYVKNAFRQIGVLQSGDTSAFDIADMYQAKFGSLGVDGQKISVKLIPVNNVTGQEGSPSEGYATVSLDA